MHVIMNFTVIALPPATCSGIATDMPHYSINKGRTDYPVSNRAVQCLIFPFSNAAHFMQMRAFL